MVNFPLSKQAVFFNHPTEQKAATTTAARAQKFFFEMYHFMKLEDRTPDGEEEEIDLNKSPLVTPSLLSTQLQQQQRQQQQEQQKEQNTNESSLRQREKDDSAMILSSSPYPRVHPIPPSNKTHKNLPPLHTIDIKQELLDPIINFYASKVNYDCMPNSGKVMVFDIDLPVRDAFYVAASNGK